MIRFEKATQKDAKALTRVSRSTFEHDVNYGAPDRGGPPGYDSEAWQRRMMRRGNYFKILAADEIIGGMIVFSAGGGHYELGRIFIHPDRQNQGIGVQALAFIEHAFLDAKRWTLNTPSWAERNHHFYEKLGYVKSGEHEPLETPFLLFSYEKTIS